MRYMCVLFFGVVLGSIGHALVPTVSAERRIHDAVYARQFVVVGPNGGELAVLGQVPDGGSGLILRRSEGGKVTVVIDGKTGRVQGKTTDRAPGSALPAAHAGRDPLPSMRDPRSGGLLKSGSTSRKILVSRWIGAYMEAHEARSGWLSVKNNDAISSSRPDMVTTLYSQYMAACRTAKQYENEYNQVGGK